MATSNAPEVWLRGPLPGISPLLQPAAHALLQAKEEITALLRDFPAQKLWDKPADMASAGFHLQHIIGVLDRLFTYARGEQLTKEQSLYLSTEGSDKTNALTTDMLLNELNKKIDETVEKLKSIAEEDLTLVRGVGRQKLPSTVIGLVFHAAEHTMRHLGQLLVTVRMIERS